MKLKQKQTTAKESGVKRSRSINLKPKIDVERFACEQDRRIIAYHLVGKTWMAAASDLRTVWTALDTPACKRNYPSIWEFLDRKQLSGNFRYAPDEHHDIWKEFAVLQAGGEAEILFFLKNGYTIDDYRRIKDYEGSCPTDDESAFAALRPAIEHCPRRERYERTGIRLELKRSWEPITLMVGALLREGALIFNSKHDREARCYEVNLLWKNVQPPHW